MTRDQQKLRNLCLWHVKNSPYYKDFADAFDLEAAMQPGAVTKPPEVRNG